MKRTNRCHGDQNPASVGEAAVKKGTPNKTAGKSNRDNAGRYLIGHTEPGPGRDSIYDPAMNEVVRKLALLGATDVEMADILGISERTFTVSNRVRKTRVRLSH